MKDILKRVGLSLSRPIDQRNYYFDFFRWKKLDQITTINQQTQILLSLKYQELHRRGAPRPPFDQVEFRSFSQHGEDGILLFLFSLLGTTNTQAVEICAGDGIECNTANLMVNHGWTGLLFDGDKNKINFGRRFYARNLNTLPYPPTLVHAWIDAENVNPLITRHGVQGEIDLLSLDMDGVDYWIWKAITCITPRVIVLEFNAALGPVQSITVPYRHDFGWQKNGRLSNYWGASLPAFVKLGKQKGYRLVGCERIGVNAFFVRAGLGEAVLPEIPIQTCFDHPRVKQVHQEFLGQAAEQEWVEV
jgi:hypothetical protein